MMPKKAAKPRVMLRVIKGGLEPADNYSLGLLRQRGYRVGDIVAGEIRKPRNPKFHRFAHQLGSLIAENIDAFHGMPAHNVLKRLQIEGGIACDELPLNIAGIGPCSYKLPQSLSFESMDEGEFKEVMVAMCAYVSRRYWPSVSPEEVERMALCWVEAA